jgi:hypothetical protein
LLLEPSLSPIAYGWLPARLLPPDQEEARAIGELLRSVCPFFVTLAYISQFEICTLRTE